MIDIIIPTYNSGDTLKSCLESICNQNSIVNNVYLINDGGTKDYDITNIPLNIVEISYESNRGPGFARNIGLDRSTSEFITFIDSDDTFTEGALESLLYNMRELPLLLGLENKYITSGEYQTTYNMFNLHGKLYRKSIIEQHNIRFPDHIHSAEDTAFNWLYQFLTSSNLKILNRVIYNYNYNNSSITNTVNDFYKNSNFIDSVKAAIWFLQDLDKRSTSLKDIEYFKYHLLYEFYVSDKHLNLISDSNIASILKEFYKYINISNTEAIKTIITDYHLEKSDEVLLDRFLNMIA